MEAYEEKASTVTVPANTGVEGFLRTLRAVLSLQRVQSIHIDSKGRVRYTRLVREGETDTPLAVDYTELAPWNLIRHGELENLRYPPDTVATTVMAHVLDYCAREDVLPIALVIGNPTNFWKWHEDTASISFSIKSFAYGLPVIVDNDVPEHAVVFCVSHLRGSLIDCHRFLLVAMPVAQPFPETSVEIFEGA
jgi:hypothetical protein